MRKITIESRDAESNEVWLWGIAESGNISCWNTYKVDPAAEFIEVAENIDSKYNRCTDWKTMDAAHNAYWLGKPATIITEADYLDALEVLPPMAWQQFSNGEERFIMAEAMDSNIYRQYYLSEREGKAVYRYINIHDRNTWITSEEVAELLKVGNTETPK